MSRPLPSLRSAYRDFLPMQTRWADNDEYGHMNNATYMSIFDTTISMWQMHNGLDIRGAKALRFLVVESGCRYFSETGFPDALHAGIRLGHLGNSSCRFEIGLFCNDQPTASAEGFFAQVLVDDRSNPTPIPARVRETLSRLLIAS